MRIRQLFTNVRSVQSGTTRIFTETNSIFLLQKESKRWRETGEWVRRTDDQIVFAQLIDKFLVIDFSPDNSKPISHTTS